MTQCVISVQSAGSEIPECWSAKLSSSYTDHCRPAYSYIPVHNALSICDLGKSVGTWTCDIFNFPIWLKCSFGRGTFSWKPHLNWSSGSKVLSNWRILRTIENNRNSFLSLEPYSSQSMLPSFDWFRKMATHNCFDVGTHVIFKCHKEWTKMTFKTIT